jgi:hypothetical protein
MFDEFLYIRMNPIGTIFVHTSVKNYIELELLGFKAISCKEHLLK